MSERKDWEIEEASLSYEVVGKEAVIVSARVHGGRVALPGTIEGFPVTKLGKKAFLSCKLLREISLPRELTEIGDWAFAYCSNLEAVRLPGRRLSLGRGIFKDCGRLASVCRLEKEGEREEQIGRLLGAALVTLEADYLFMPKEAGKEGWLRRFDEKLGEFLAQPDEDGFVKMVYCGEEDIIANVEHYLAERKRAKARMCYLRLINSVGLSEKLRGELCGYLRAHTKECPSEAAWEVVFEEHGSERDYYEAFTGAGCLTEENYEAVLTRMGESFPEMKAYLMRYRAQNLRKPDFFASLSLD